LQNSINKNLNGASALAITSLGVTSPESSTSTPSSSYTSNVQTSTYASILSTLIPTSSTSSVPFNLISCIVTLNMVFNSNQTNFVDMNSPKVQEFITNFNAYVIF